MWFNAANKPADFLLRLRGRLFQQVLPEPDRNRSFYLLFFHLREYLSPIGRTLFHRFYAIIAY